MIGDKPYEERIVEQLTDVMEADLTDLLKRLMPEGRRPFVKKLSERETVERILEATPADFEGWQKALVQPGMEPKELARARADWIKAFSWRQMVEAGWVEPTVESYRAWRYGKEG